MRTKEIYEFGFDPKESDIEIIKDRVGLILWTCIKSCHITDQYFNDNIKFVVDLINSKKPADYFAFRKIIETKLSRFGVVCVEENMYQTTSVIDNEFWGDIWMAIKGKRFFKIEITLDKQS